jgi:hypothetical protein
VRSPSSALPPLSSVLSLYHASPYPTHLYLASVPSVPAGKWKP